MSQGTDFSASWIHYPGEPIGSSPVGNRSDGHRVKLFEESVTFIAHLEGSDMVPPLDRTWMIGKWRVPEYQIPIIIGVSSGVLILLLTVAVLIIWRCCRMQNFDEKKAYGSNLEEGRTPVMASPSSSSFPSVLLSLSSSSKPASPSLTIRTGSKQHLTSTTTAISSSSTYELIRIQQPAAAPSAADENLQEQQQQQQEALQHLLQQRRSCEDMSQLGLGGYVGFDLPDCPDSFNNSSGCASSSALDFVPWVSADLESELKTRSLPAWARNKGVRAVQSIDQMESPPRKNAKRSQQQQQHVPKRDPISGGGPMDRVSLGPRSEAAPTMIVFNERTAL